MLSQGACPGNIAGAGAFCCLAPTLKGGLVMFGLLAEWLRIAAGELRAALVDAAQEGDYRGHIAAWWALMVGRVDPEDRYNLARGGRL